MIEDVISLPELPQGWVWTTLGEVGVVASGGTPSTKDPENFGGEIPWITPADLSDFSGKFIDRGKRSISEKGLYSSSAVLIPAGSVLFSSRAPIGYVAIAANPSATNQGFKSLIPAEGVFNEYVFYYLMGSKKLAEAFASGTTFLEVSKSKFAQIPIPLPPLSEQRRIVAKIEELFTQLDAGVAALEQAQAQLRRYHQAVLKAAVEGKLTGEWREAHWGEVEPASVLLERILEERRAKWETEQLAKMKAKGKMPKDDKWKTKYKEPISPDALESRESPLGWVRATLDQLSYHVTSGSRGWAKYYADTGALFIRVGNFNHLDTAIDLREPVFVNAPSGPEADRTRLQVGDLLITITADVGMVGIVDERILKWGEAYINQHVGLVRLSLPGIIAFVAYACASDYVQEQIRNKQYGVTKKGLGLEDLKSLEVPLPPLAEQQRIVDEVEWRLSVVYETEKAVEQSPKPAERLRQSILKMAFEGKLVPQDPADEPASVLLERIKASRKRLDEERRRRKAAQRRQRAKHRKRQEVSISTATELRGLLKQLQHQSGSPVPASELWQSSNLDMDTFQALLREEIRAGRIHERREGYIAFLETAK